MARKTCAYPLRSPPTSVVLRRMRRQTCLTRKHSTKPGPPTHSISTRVVLHRLRSSPAPRKRPRQDMVADSGEVEWKKLSREFRNLLQAGSLEPQELNTLYCRKFKKVVCVYVMCLVLIMHAVVEDGAARILTMLGRGYLPSFARRKLCFARAVPSTKSSTVRGVTREETLRINPPGRSIPICRNCHVSRSWYMDTICPVCSRCVCTCACFCWAMELA